MRNGPQEQNARPGHGKKRPVIIVGAGEAASLLIRKY